MRSLSGQVGALLSRDSLAVRHLLEFTGASITYRFSEDALTFGGYSYEARLIISEAVAYDERIGIVPFAVELSNISLETATMLRTEGTSLRGAAITLKRLFLEADEAYTLIVGRIGSVKVSEQTARISVVAELNSSFVVPKRNYGPLCKEDFKDSSCGYVGGLTVCAKTFPHCVTRGRTHRFSGFIHITNNLSEIFGSKEAAAALADSGANADKLVALAYGTHAVGGNMVMLDASGDTAVAIVALGQGVWDKPESFYAIINDSLVPIDITLASQFHFHRGLLGELSSGGGLNPEGTGSPSPFTSDGDQKVDSFFDGLVNPDDETIQGITFSRTAYVAVKLPVMPDSGAVRFVGRFRTKKVNSYDYNGNSLGLAFHELMPWHLLDLLIQERGLATARVNFASFATAAAYCSAAINPVSGSVARFQSATAFSEATNLTEAVESMLITSRAKLLEADGKIYLRIDQPRGASFSFTMANIVAGSFAVTYEDTTELPNRIETAFRDYDNDLAPALTTWNDEAQQARVGRVIVERLNLGVMPAQQAERIAIWRLGTGVGAPMTCALTGHFSSFAVMPGDSVNVAHDAAPWTGSKQFVVEEVSENENLTRNFKLREYNSAAYTDSSLGTQALENTTLPSGTGEGGGAAVPPAPSSFLLTANTVGDIRLAFPIPANADYQQGTITVLVDDMDNRVSTQLLANLGAGDGTMQVLSSAGFKVGDFVGVGGGGEIVKITGPGTTGSQPSSNTWTIDRAQKSTTAEAVNSSSGLDIDSPFDKNAVYLLTPIPLPIPFEPGYTLAHPTTNPADSGQYWVVRFHPGRPWRIMHASLEFTSPQGMASAAIENGYTAVGSTPGNLQGIRTFAGEADSIIFSGPLFISDDAVPLKSLPSGRTLGTLNAAMLGGPIGRDVLFRIDTHIREAMTINGVSIPAGKIYRGGSITIPQVGGVSYGEVRAVQLSDPGAGYHIGDLVTLSAGANNCLLFVDYVDPIVGMLIHATIVDCGSAYSLAEAVSVSGGNGSGAKFDIVELVPTPSSVGTFASGALFGPVGNVVYNLVVQQTGSDEPGSDLTVYMRN